MAAESKSAKGKATFSKAVRHPPRDCSTQGSHMRHTALACFMFWKPTSQPHQISQRARSFHPQLPFQTAFPSSALASEESVHSPPQPAEMKREAWAKIALCTGVQLLMQSCKCLHTIGIVLCIGAVCNVQSRRRICELNAALSEVDFGAIHWSCSPHIIQSNKN